MIVSVAHTTLHIAESNMSARFTAWLLFLGWAGTLEAASLSLDQLIFDPAMGMSNRVQITIQTNIGSDNDATNVSGTVSGTLDYNWIAGQPVPVGFTFHGGEIALSDVEFSFLFGLVTARTEGIRGTPSTPNPPSTITAGMYQASDHTVTFDQGSIIAAGSAIDLTTNPIIGAGTGVGTAEILSVGPDRYEFTMTLPIEFNEPFEVIDVPVVGTVTGNVIGSGLLLARQEFTLSLPAGDYNGDGILDCGDIDELQAAIAAGSTDLTYDANQDGLVTEDDYQAWVIDLKGTLLGDANLDFRVDGTDFGTWNGNKFESGQGWCQGDFTGEGNVDGTDFGRWNANKFRVAAGTATLTPEPAIAWGWLLWTGLISRRWTRWDRGPGI